MTNRLIKLFPFMLLGFEKQGINKEKARTEIFKRTESLKSGQPRGGYCEQEIIFRKKIENRNK